jgi:hypothetical protein
LSIHGEVQIHQSTTAFQEAIQFRDALIRPLRIVRIKDNYIGLGPLLGRWPAVGSLSRDFVFKAKQF